MALIRCEDALKVITDRLNDVDTTDEEKQAFCEAVSDNCNLTGSVTVTCEDLRHPSLSNGIQCLDGLLFMAPGDVTRYPSDDNELVYRNDQDGEGWYVAGAEGESVCLDPVPGQLIEQNDSTGCISLTADNLLDVTDNTNLLVVRNNRLYLNMQAIISENPGDLELDGEGKLAVPWKAFPNFRFTAAGQVQQTWIPQEATRARVIAVSGSADADYSGVTVSISGATQLGGSAITVSQTAVSALTDQAGKHVNMQVQNWPADAADVFFVVHYT